jgi:hypothetical protein
VAVVAGLLWVLWSAAVGLYKVIDSKGMIPHEAEVSITAQGNWLVGESKTCATFPGNPSNPQTGDAISFVSCDEGPAHQIRVEFWGRKRQAEYSAVYWKCKKEDSSFTCAELSATTAK